MSCSKTKSKFIRAFRSKAFCHSRTLSLPQALQRWISLWTLCPHDLQGTGILLPFRILAKWILQYSPRQLFPQILVSPLLSHSQLFDPFIFTIYLKIAFFSNWYAIYKKLSGCSPSWLLKPNRRPDMQNWGPSACRCGMFFVQGGPEPPSAKWEHAEFPRVRKVFIAHEASM